MRDKRKACEEMLDTQLEELRMQIGLFMPRAGKDKAVVAGKWRGESKN